MTPGDEIMYLQSKISLAFFSFSHLEKRRSILSHESIRLGLILVVQGVQVELILVVEEALAHNQWQVCTLLQLSEEMLRVELVDFLDVAEDDVPLPAQCLRYILA